MAGECLRRLVEGSLTLLVPHREVLAEHLRRDERHLTCDSFDFCEAQIDD